MLVLPVGLSVITNNPIGVGGWSRLNVSRGNLSVKVVVESLEETVSEIHIADWVDALWEVDASWKLTVSGSPVVLNAFHVPLVDHDNDSLLWCRVNLLEKVLISSVNEYSLQGWEVDIKILNVPVDLVLVKAFLRVL